MPAFTPSDIADLVNACRPDHVDEQLVDLMSDFYDHVAMRTLIEKHMEDGDPGSETEFDLITASNGTARPAPMFFQRNPTVVDVTKRGKVQYVRHTANWTLEESEVPINGTRQDVKGKVFSIRAARRGPALQSIHTMIEGEWWSKPADSSDREKLLGLKAWIVKSISGSSAAAQGGGFNGTDPAGFTTAGIGNVLSSVEPRWANWAHQYTLFNRDDAIFKLRNMRARTGFRSSVTPKVQEIVSGANPDRAYYGNTATVLNAENILYNQNDNLGGDLLGYEGSTTIARVPFVMVPHLDADTENPIYQTDWRFFRMLRKPGQEWLGESSKPLGDRPTTIVTDILTPWWQMICINRRAQGVLSTGASITT